MISVNDVHLRADIMEAVMQVSKCGNSLAVRLPRALVDQLGLVPVDELRVVEASKGQIAVEKFAFYDDLIVAAAVDAGCDIVYSEGMQHARAIGGLTIRNPFMETGV
jgi:predicted nucleic acid-binding protein